jgi:hypothetical protein
VHTESREHDIVLDYDSTPPLKQRIPDVEKKKKK